MSLRARVVSFKEFVRKALGKDLSELTTRDSMVVYPIRFFVYIGRELKEDNCFLQASALAYKTILTVVPLLVVAFGLLKVFGSFENADSRLIGLLVDLNLIPVSADEIAGELTKLTRGVSAGALGGAGMAGLVILAILLFDNVEKVFNDIFKVEQRRPLVSRFLTFYAIITLGPLAVTGSLYFTSEVNRVFEGGALIRFIKEAFIAYMLPFLISWIGLAFMYRFMPNTRVRMRAALSGAALAAFFFELAKVGFAFYVTNMAGSSWGKLYGAMALFPMFLIWIYIAWVITLFGGEVAYTLQNMHILMLADQERRTRLAERIDKSFATRIFLEIARQFRAGRAPVDSDDLAVSFRLTAGLIELVCRRFVDAGLLLQLQDEDDSAGYVLARPPDAIPIGEVLDAFGVGYLQVTPEVERELGQARFSGLWDSIQSSRLELIDGVSVMDMLERAPESSA